jgi:hypothetical protein
LRRRPDGGRSSCSRPRTAPRPPATLDGWQTLYAYERYVIKRRASRLRPMIGRKGMIATIEELVTRPEPSTGFVELAKVGMLDLTAEALVLRHPAEFSPEAIARSKERLDDQEDRKG